MVYVLSEWELVETEDQLVGCVSSYLSSITVVVVTL